MMRLRSRTVDHYRPPTSAPQMAARYISSGEYGKAREVLNNWGDKIPYGVLNIGIARGLSERIGLLERRAGLGIDGSRSGAERLERMRELAGRLESGESSYTDAVLLMERIEADPSNVNWRVEELYSA